jgi:hypothetical protein
MLISCLNEEDTDKRSGIGAHLTWHWLRASGEVQGADDAGKPA